MVVVVWWCGVAVRLDGGMVVWWCGGVAVRLDGGMVVWWCGEMIRVQLI